MIEVEVKIEVKDFSEIEELLRRENFDKVGDWIFEDNYVFDYEDLKLKNEGKLLRVRKAGNEIIITYKRKIEDSIVKYKVREEKEVQVDDFNSIIEIFEGIGFKVFFRYQKYRKIYSKDNYHICLDRTPVGNFIEIEGDENFIKFYASKLGFKEDNFLKRTYYEIFLERRREGENFMIFNK